MQNTVLSKYRSFEDDIALDTEVKCTTIGPHLYRGFLHVIKLPSINAGSSL